MALADMFRVCEMKCMTASVASAVALAVMLALGCLAVPVGVAHAKTVTITAEQAAELDAAPKKGTLDYALHKRCQATLAKVTKPKRSKARQLRDVWKYVTDKSVFRYRSHSFSFKDKTWAKRYAYQMLGSHRGNCYGFASMFAALATEVGYKAKVVTCKVDLNSRKPHGVVKINGKFYDPEAAVQGFHKNIYGKKKYPFHIKIGTVKLFSSFDGSCAPAGVFGKPKAARLAKPVVVKTAAGYAGYLGKKGGKRLKGVWCAKGRLYKFDAKGRMPASEFAAVRAASAEGKPWVELRALLGAPKATYETPSCYGAGKDHHYRYAHVEVQTFAPAADGEETVIGFEAL